MSEIKEAYTTRELAEFKGIAPKNLLSRAKRENWPSRPRSGQGGGFEYPTVKLPADVREAIALAVSAEERENGLFVTLEHARELSQKSAMRPPSIKTPSFPSRIFLPVNGMSCCHARCLLTPYTILKWQDIRAGRQSSLWLKDTKTAHCRKTSWMQPMLPTPGAALHAGFPLPDFMVGVRHMKQRASLVWFPSIRKRI